MGHVTEDTGLYPGWVPGPNPFGNQRADSTQTWYRREIGRQFEIRFDYHTELWVISLSIEESNRARRNLTHSQWGLFRVCSSHRFSDPMGAMLWFEMNKGEL